MRVRNTSEHFGAIGKLFHWTLALLIIALVWLGWVMVDLNYYHPWYNTSLDAHKSLGMIVLFLAAAKVLWSAYSPTPALAASLSAWERTLAGAVHRFLVTMMFAVPITGYVISTSAGDAVSVFDWFEIPAVIADNEKVRDIAIEVHYYAAYVTILVVAMHAGAALKHQFIDRDGTLRRML